MNALPEAVRAEVLALLTSMKQDVRILAHRGGPLDARHEIPRDSKWQPLPGRDGVQFFHVPAAGGGKELHAAHFDTLAGASYTGSVLDCSRLIVLSHGTLRCNGRALAPGRSCWLAAGEPTTWHSPDGCQGVVFYDAPNPASDGLALAP